MIGILIVVGAAALSIILCILTDHKEEIWESIEFKGGLSVKDKR